MRRCNCQVKGETTGAPPCKSPKSKLQSKTQGSEWGLRSRLASVSRTVFFLCSGEPIGVIVAHKRVAWHEEAACSGCMRRG